jgi:nucleoside-diphosphate-sugar epimerase
VTRALVIGGTGPTGPAVVNGLLDRAYEVSVLHSGLHEVEFSANVEHLHADPNYEEPLRQILAKRDFDIAVGMYGRARIVADVLAGKVDRFVAVGGVFYEGWVDPRHLSLATNETELEAPEYGDAPWSVNESHPLDPNSRFAGRALETEKSIRYLHSSGAFRATFLRFPKLYGPRQMAPVEWSIIRRALDKRARIIVPDGGLLLETRLYSENAARIVLGAVDHPYEASGQTFNCGDEDTLSIRSWVQTISEVVGHSFDMVSVPYPLSGPALIYSLTPWLLNHRVLDVTKAKSLLGYQGIPARHAIGETVRWYVDNPPGDEDETISQLGDVFDYEAEDHLLELADQFGTAVRIEGLQAARRYYHPYRHPPMPEEPKGS